MSKKYLKDTIVLNNRVSSKKRNRVLDELDEVDSFILPSSISSRISPKGKKEEKEEKSEVETDDWLNAIVSIKAPKQKKKMKKTFQGFIRDGEDKGKKGKKKKVGGELTNYHKEFEPELNALKDLFGKQSKFSETLQMMYDEMNGKKATARGVGKFTIDLVEAISSSRSTTLSILDKIIGTKKTVSELSMKEKEKFGKKSGSEFENNAQFASAFLAKAIQSNRDTLNTMELPFDTGYSEVNSFDDVSNLLEDALGPDTRDPSVEAFLKYEGKGVEIYIMKDNEGNWDFQAEDKEGNMIFDYPLPQKGKITFFDDMNKGVDEFGQEYKIRWQ